MYSVREHSSGGWFVYTPYRVLGPFRWEGQANKAARREEASDREG